MRKWGAAMQVAERSIPMLTQWNDDFDPESCTEEYIQAFQQAMEAVYVRQQKAS